MRAGDSPILTFALTAGDGKQSQSLKQLGTTKISLVFRRSSTRAGDSPILTFPLREEGTSSLHASPFPLPTGFYAGRGVVGRRPLLSLPGIVGYFG